MRYPDALQRSSALATRMDLQNKATNASKPIWVTVADEFMDGTDSGGLVKKHEKFIKHNINPESISKIGSFTSGQACDLFKEISRAYAIVKKRYEASGQHNGKDFLDFCGQLTQSTQLDMLN
jgi:chaperonin GroEL (HSP60 family)